jgi:hypothetical protein
VYTTKPGGALFFPALATSTGQLVIPESGGPAPSNRGLMMPTRQRTRAQERAYRIALERQHSAARIARKQLLLAERIARDDQPPPFWGAPKSAQSPASSHSTETQTVGAAAVSIPVTVHSDSGMSASPLTQLMPTL